MKGFLKEYKYRVLLGAAILMLTPLGINLVVVFSQNIIPIAENNDWIGFFGSYSGSLIGGVIGALIAIYVAKIQVSQQKSNFEKDLDFRLETQQNEFDNQLKVYEKRNQEEEENLIKQAHKNQLIYLVELELEMIKIKNGSYRLYENYYEYVYSKDGNNNYKISARQEELHDEVWNSLSYLVDFNLQFRLKQLRNQYNDMVEMILLNIWEIEIDFRNKRLEYNKLNMQKNRTEKENIEHKKLEIEYEILKGKLSYYEHEKKYFWEKASTQEYVFFAEKCRSLIRESIITSCEMNDLEIPIDPNTL